ncbi:MAG: Gfo/Idh/MocA family oxidoreductase [Verrucomicrobiae bacterium]|nr:Gfo/Idh/MocA family oxidoreductase [Verrucomicrobiae bacterium]
MRLTRRQFLQAGSAASSAWFLAGCASAPKRVPRALSPNDKLNLGVIGVTGRGGENLAGVASQNIVALADVSGANLAAAAAKFPSARTYSDWRRVLDHADIDAVVVSTPDHTHAVIALAVLASGRPLYLEKPVTHTISEARALSEAVRRTGLVTQTGNQIHSSTNYRRVVELVRSGAIGPVREVHHWTGSVWETKPWPAPAPVPVDLNYDLWVGPVQWADYSPEWVPFNWRRWWHWGGGTLSDFCCHHIDLSVWALDLGLPQVIEASGPPPDKHCAPPSLKVRYEFAARGPQPPVVMHWYSGSERPQVPGTPDLSSWGGGTLFVGDRGMLLADYGRRILLPDADFKDFTPPPQTIPDSIGHHEEWIQACKGEGTPGSPLTYGAQLTEIGALGNVAFRTGKRIEWDAPRMKARGVPEADQYIHHHYRSGWSLRS